MTQKLELGYTFAENWSIAGSLFGAYHNIKNVPTIPVNVSGYRFDGLSFEIRHRILERTATSRLRLRLQPNLAGRGTMATACGATLSASKRSFRSMRDHGPPVLGNERQLRDGGPAGRADKPVVVIIRFGCVHRARLLADGRQTLPWREARWLQGYENTFFGKRTEYAVFIGPTLQAKVAENVSINFTIQPQIAGKVDGVPANQAIDPFDRALARFKIAVGF